jgi:tetratricopeptide (TPR) repeat protein
MVMLMIKRLTAISKRITTGILLLLVVATLPVMAAKPDSEGLQQLLYGEALFLSHQQDYLTAIVRLQLAEDQQQQSSSAIDARLLLARLKLAYGLHIEAGFDFHALLDDELPDEVRNRAWYELARAFSHKGYYEAAAEALGNIKGKLPDDIAGDYQLLYATVLMALEQNLQAAQAGKRRRTAGIARQGTLVAGLCLGQEGGLQAGAQATGERSSGGAVFEPGVAGAGLDSSEAGAGRSRAGSLDRAARSFSDGPGCAGNIAGGTCRASRSGCPADSDPRL